MSLTKTRGALKKMSEETRTDQDATAPADRRRVSVAEALARLPGAGGERFAKVLEHGSLVVEIYAPRGSDPQQPHTRDEVYVVFAGTGHFVNGDARHAFAPGDLLFVPAGIPHRFEDFTEDLVVWVIFYGPEGGE
jgi:mannose-6-phosphate isomerase-like protein (cupin superfamily)